MPVPSLLSARQWSDLPKCLQEHILSFLKREARHKPVDISLSSAESMLTALPKDLLSVASVSEEFKMHVVNVLRSRAKYLTTEVAKDDLLDWISVLAPFLKAVSLWDSQMVEECENQKLNQAFFNALCNDAVLLFKSLSEDPISLQVLDLKNVPFVRDNRPKQKKQELYDGLVSTLQQSRQSLKELALPVSRQCAWALAQVYLPRLEVLELEFRDLQSVPLSERKRKIFCAPFLNMLQAIDTHTRRPRRRATLRELRLIFFYEPTTNISMPGQPLYLFNTVTTLSVDVYLPADQNNEAYPLLIGLFPNVKSLRWNGAIRESHLNMVNRACPHIGELHLDSRLFYTRISSRQILFEEVSIEDALEVSRGLVKKLIVEYFLRSDQLIRMGEVCAGLEHLGLLIDKNNIQAASLILRNYCRRLRSLDLSFARDLHNRPNHEHWQILTESVLLAANGIHDMRISGLDTWQVTPNPEEVMVRFVLNMIEFLGEQARNFYVHLGPINYPDYVSVIDILIRIMAKCSTHAMGLEQLYLGFNIDPTPTKVDNPYYEEENRLLSRLLAEKELVLEAMPKLKSFHISAMHPGRLESLEEDLA